MGRAMLFTVLGFIVIIGMVRNNINKTSENSSGNPAIYGSFSPGSSDTTTTLDTTGTDDIYYSTQGISEALEAFNAGGGGFLAVDLRGLSARQYGMNESRNLIG